MKIVILTGGTGSIALQEGIYAELESKVEGVDVKIITNAYDNGLSTGAVRKVLGGKILGPSDVRKNQTTRLKLQEPSSPWNKFLDIRFSAPAFDAKKFCYEKIDALELELRYAKHPSVNDVYSIKDAVDFFFSAPLAMSIDYTDFSLANIIYAGLARAYGNSLRDAAKQMAHVLQIKDNVLLNSDESLFLGAISKSGKRVTDEGDIVSWGKLDDPFVDIFYTDIHGNEKLPVLCDEAKEALLEADLIILSTGTQWSSLIPTYASVGFKETMEQVTAKVILVMNKIPDQDSPGQGADDIINIIAPKYFNPEQLHVVLTREAPEQMRVLSDATIEAIGSHKSFMLDSPMRVASEFRKHGSKQLFQAVAETFFGDYLDSSHFMFDYDDTLVGRGNSFPKASDTNLTLFKHISRKRKLSICTGNSIKAINLKALPEDTEWGYVNTQVDVFADGGVNHYLCNTYPPKDSKPVHFVRCLEPHLLLNGHTCNVDFITDVLMTNGINPSKIENRGDVMISIKPIEDEYRPIVINLLDRLFNEFDIDLTVKASGRTTVEMFRSSLSKKFAVEFTLASPNVKMITYVGDELKNGNDAVVAAMSNSKLQCLSVNNPTKTAFFLITLDNFTVGK